MWLCVLCDLLCEVLYVLVCVGDLLCGAVDVFVFVFIVVVRL